MDSVDITDTAFSLESANILNDIISSTTDLVEGTGTGSDTDIDQMTNIYFIIGIVFFIGGIFLYSYLTNQKKNVTFQENNNEVYEYQKSV
jgi:preprotein translocase subunit SecG